MKKVSRRTGAKIVDLFEALKQSLAIEKLRELDHSGVPMTTGFCPDCSEVHDVPERDGYEGTCGCGCDFITDIDAGEDGEACFRLIRARLCQRCVAGVCSEHQPVDASDDRARTSETNIEYSSAEFVQKEKT